MFSVLPGANPSSAQEQGTNPDVHVVPNYMLRVLPNMPRVPLTFGTWAVNLLDRLKHSMRMSLMISNWKPFFDGFTGNFLFGEVRTKKVLKTVLFKTNVRVAVT